MPGLGGRGWTAAHRLDNAVEKLLNAPAIETLPEQLAKLRFLFEEEFDKLWFDAPSDVDMMLHDRWP